ncbi:MAG: DNA-binding protein [Alphaproteobacteria bacterium HGW-Alphaproteobacteria-18]|nr:MAG: DNA-binding protein [Alphaproteobacteria bacterium HGW-Alphaproteobacteria-18]
MGEAGEIWSTGADGPYWDGLARGQLMLPVCGGCGRWHWPAVWRCGDCGSWDHGWQQVVPAGRIYSWTRNWHPFGGLESLKVPFLIGIIELEAAGGARLMGLVEEAGTPVKIGAPVAGTFGSTMYAGRAVPAIHWRTS